jgi:hypothetical protein
MPFNRSTRQNFLAAPTITYAAGATTQSQLPKVGLLRRIFVLFAGTLTVTLGGGTAVIGQEAPFSLIQRLQLVANGNTNVFDTSGWGGMIQSLFSAFGFSGFGGRPIVPDSATAPGPAATGFSALNFAAGVSAGANTWRFAIEIPLGLADDWRPPQGLLLAAAPDTQLSLNVTFGATLFSTTAARTVPVTVTGAATATLTGTITPVVEFFTIPANPADYPDLRRVHTWTEVGPQVIAANGPQQVLIGRGNTVQRIVHIVHTNTLPDATNVTSRQLSYNQNEIPYSTTLQGDAVIQRKRYVRDLPDGTYVWDLWNSGTPRDAVNTLNLNELISTLNVSGATIAGVSDIRTLIEQLITLTGAVAGSA